jgi:hypothetical protein
MGPKWTQMKVARQFLSRPKVTNLFEVGRVTTEMEKTEERMDKHDLCTAHSLHELPVQTDRTQLHSKRITEN